MSEPSTAAERTRDQVLATVAAIPEGRVTTYGTIGRLIGTTARRVARILATLTAEESQELPWFRVVAANGVVRSMKLGAVGRRQVARLRAEGVEVNGRNRVMDFAAVVWNPES